MKFKKISIIASILLLVIGLSVTLSLLVSQSGPIVNTFAPGKVPPKIIEAIEGNVKEEVKVQNTGNIDAYIRVFLAANYTDEQGNILNIEAKLPTITSDDWFYFNGYYYYKHIVSPDQCTNPLFQNFEMEPVAGNEEAIYELQVLASSVQADPADAVKELWDVQVVDEKLEPGGTP